MAYDEMELDTIGDKKTALFLIMSDTDSTFNFVIAILQSQLSRLEVILPCLLYYFISSVICASQKKPMLRIGLFRL